MDIIPDAQVWSVIRNLGGDFEMSSPYTVSNQLSAQPMGGTQREGMVFDGIALEVAQNVVARVGITHAAQVIRRK